MALKPGSTGLAEARFGSLLVRAHYARSRASHLSPNITLFGGVWNGRDDAIQHPDGSGAVPPPSIYPCYPSITWICEVSMRFGVRQVEALVREFLDETRRAMDVPVFLDFLDRFPGGRNIRALIEDRFAARAERTESLPLDHSSHPASTPIPVEPTSEPVLARPSPPRKARRPAGGPSAAEPPVPVGTRVRILTGTFKDWTGHLQWSPAKRAYNVRLTGPEGRQARTTLSPARLGKSWEVESEGAPTPPGAKRTRKLPKV